MEWNRGLRNKSMHLILDKVTKTYIEEKIPSSTNGIGRTGYPHKTKTI
jgi:hypothetical protein